MTLVNLHMQANRPIVDSPLLMSSYLTHLAQVTFYPYMIQPDLIKKLINRFAAQIGLTVHCL